MCSNKYSAELEHEEIRLNKVPNKFIIDKTSLGIFQTALRSKINTKTINNYNTAIFLEDQEGIDKALEHLTDFIMNTARCTFKQKKTMNFRKKKRNNLKHIKSGIPVNVRLLNQCWRLQNKILKEIQMTKL